MCEPTTIMMGVQLAGVALAGYGQYQQGQSAKAQAGYNAQVAENDAKVKDWAAEDAVQRGQIAEDAKRREVRQVKGAQRAAMGAGGDLTDQSSVNVLQDTAQFGELDALTIRSNAAREAWGIKAGAVNDRAQAVSDRFQGRAAGRAGNMAAGGTLLSGAAKAYGQFNRIS